MFKNRPVFFIASILNQNGKSSPGISSAVSSGAGEGSGSDGAGAGP